MAAAAAKEAEVRWLRAHQHSPHCVVVEGIQESREAVPPLGDCHVPLIPAKERCSGNQKRRPAKQSVVIWGCEGGKVALLFLRR